jgi:hypothetical protein
MNHLFRFSHLLVGLEQYQRVEIPISYMANDRRYESELGQILLGVVYQVRKFRYRNTVPP